MTMPDLTRSRRAGVANPARSNPNALVVVLALSCLSFVGEGQEKAGDAKPDVNDIRAKAEKGDAQAQFDLGWMYDEGKRVEQDSTEATKWYRKAAEQGFAKAQLNLGAMYENGEGIPQDYKEAARWNLKASEQGITLAEVNMGRFYRDGKGVPTSSTEAVRWFRKAADKGESNGQMQLGFAYFHGAGVAKDETEALKWFRLAAQQGNTKPGKARDRLVRLADARNEARAKAEKGDAQAQFDLGWMYDEGKSVEQDAAEAAKWYREAASRGQKRAQFKLGFMYSTGWGVERNDVEAVKWLNLAAGQGYVYAAQLRDVLVQAMTSEEATEAQRRAARFVLMGQNGESQPQAGSPVPRSIQAEDKAASQARGILGDN
jgi:TPR repeat protein